MLKDKVAVVTGGSRGIGAAIVSELAARGARVALLYLGSEDKARAAAERQAGVRAFRCDVSDFSQCRDTVKAVLAAFGKIDILVNNAGITRDSLVLTMPPEDFDRVLDVNLKGCFYMIKCCLRGFLKNKYGKIINLSSVAGITGNAAQANYAASKAGVIGLTKAVAREVAGKNICCNAIAPGFIKTEMTEAFSENEAVLARIPKKRVGRPEEVAQLAAFLADDASDYITGEVIQIDGGLAI